MKKTIITIIVALVLVAVLVGLYFYLGTQKNVAEGPAVQGNAEGNSTAQAIAKDFALKYNQPESSFMIDVTTDTGTFAKGSVEFADALKSGGLWFAAHTATGWELAFDGNGIIPCDSANKYDFPKDIIPQCIDTLHDNNLIQR